MRDYIFIEIMNTCGISKMMKVLALGIIGFGLFSTAGLIILPDNPKPIEIEEKENI